MDDGAPAFTVVEGDVVQHQSFAGVEADARFHLAHDVVPAVTVKLGPSGWVMLMGFWVVRSGPVSSGSV